MAEKIINRMRWCSPDWDRDADTGKEATEQFRREVERRHPGLKFVVKVLPSDRSMDPLDLCAVVYG